jgi:cytochrome c oxidase subunit 2
MEPHYGWGFPPNLSTYGGAIDQLINVVHIFAALLFVGWGIYLIYCLVRFRSRPGHSASYTSTKTRFPKMIEVGVVLFETFLLIGLSYPIWSRYKSEFPPQDESVLIRVVAQQFVWNIHYPGPDRQFGRMNPSLVDDVNPLGLDRAGDPAAVDDLVNQNQLHFPVDRPVIVYLTSRDVIHSFAIPVLRVKQDAVPGMVTPVWFQANAMGNFEIMCAQLCGVGHTLMRGFVTIETEADFQRWLEEEAKANLL